MSMRVAMSAKAVPKTRRSKVERVTYISYGIDTILSEVMEFCDVFLISHMKYIVDPLHSKSDVVIKNCL